MCVHVLERSGDGGAERDGYVVMGNCLWIGLQCVCVWGGGVGGSGEGGYPYVQVESLIVPFHSHREHMYVVAFMPVNAL